MPHVPSTTMGGADDDCSSIHWKDHRWEIVCGWQESDHLILGSSARHRAYLLFSRIFPDIDFVCNWYILRDFSSTRRSME